jgi:hypothetical protein
MKVYIKNSYKESKKSTATLEYLHSKKNTALIDHQILDVITSFHVVV